jgi:hypothetical protein
LLLNIFGKKEDLRGSPGLLRDHAYEDQQITRTESQKFGNEGWHFIAMFPALLFNSNLTENISLRG